MVAVGRAAAAAWLAAVAATEAARGCCRDEQRSAG